MPDLDLPYLCTLVGNLSSIPIRLYEDNQQVLYHALVHLPADPVRLCLDQLRSFPDGLNYHVTKEFLYYGVVHSGRHCIIVGPTSQTPVPETQLRELAFSLDISPADTDVFIKGMEGILHMPLESILQMLCSINYLLNGEKLQLNDVLSRNASQEDVLHLLQNREEAAFYNPVPSPLDFQHTSYDIEQMVMQLVEQGDLEELQRFAESAPAVRGGRIAQDQLRQLKNTFIVTSTLATRAAIRGGVPVETALSLSDAFIQRCELLSDPGKISDLQLRMVLEMTEEVRRCHLQGMNSDLPKKVLAYIRSHLSEPVTAEALAQHLFISRPYLSKKFREETGITLTDFILTQKTEEAKRLLRYTDKSSAAIAAYLGFSSEGHFSRVFKKYTGTTPAAYRSSRLPISMTK